MATITYDNASPAAGDELNADEQDSLRVGEELAGQQEELLAGKFKSAEDLARAYQELESKLGSRSEEQAEEAEPEEKEEEAKPSDFLERLYAEALDDSSEEYSKELMDELRQMDVEDLAQMYLEYRSQAEESQPSAEPMSADDEVAIMNAIGGEETYKDMLGWAQENLSEQEINMYDQVMELGNPLAAYFAAQALAYRFNDARGSEGEMLSGRAPSTSGNVFRSQAELLEALSDPRYDRDPAYRQDVAAKLERSEGVF